jgi:hypothetical protein
MVVRGRHVLDSELRITTTERITATKLIAAAERVTAAERIADNSTRIEQRGSGAKTDEPHRSRVSAACRGPSAFTGSDRAAVANSITVAERVSFAVSIA